MYVIESELKVKAESHPLKNKCCCSGADSPAIVLTHYFHKHISIESQKILTCLYLVLLHYIVQTAERLQSQEVEECSRCDIEILNTEAGFDDAARLINVEPLDTQVSRGSQSTPSTEALSCVPLHTDYCPQTVTVFSEGQALQQIPCVSNKTYFHNVEQDLSEVRDNVNFLRV